jgi:cytochrome c biogenesis protein CcmG/thiol:disulfide interchange protein DsbE
MSESSDIVSESRSTGFRWARFVVIGGVVLLLAVLGWGLIKQSGGRPEGRAPDFTLTLFEGYEYKGRQEVTLSDLQGQVVVINFWAEWCTECKVEAELLESTWKAYRDRGVVFLGVDWVDVETEARKYLTRYSITYPNGPDLGSRIGQRYGLTGVPETFFVDKTGAVSNYKLGPLSERELTTKLDELLAQP